MMVAATARQSRAQVAVRPSPTAPAESFETGVVNGNFRLSQRRAISRLVLESIEPAADDINPIWAAETNRRVLNLLQLIFTKPQRGIQKHRVMEGWGPAYERAKRLMNTYRSLEYYDQFQLVPCEQIIRDIVTGLVDVFSGINGVTELAIQIQSLSLQAKKRRALALLISELVISALLYGTKRMALSRLAIFVAREENLSGYIGVETSCPLSHSFASPGHELVCALSGILEAEIAYGETLSGGTRIKILIP